MCLDAEQVTSSQPWSALDDSVTRTVHSPVHHHHPISVPGDPYPAVHFAFGHQHPGLTQAAITAELVSALEDCSGLS